MVIERRLVDIEHQTGTNVRVFPDIHVALPVSLPFDSNPDTINQGGSCSLARVWINAPYFALFGFPGAVPQLAVDPGDTGDEAV